LGWGFRLYLCLPFLIDLFLSLFSSLSTGFFVLCSSSIFLQKSKLIINILTAYNVRLCYTEGNTSRNCSWKDNKPPLVPWPSFRTLISSCLQPLNLRITSHSRLDAVYCEQSPKSGWSTAAAIPTPQCLRTGSRWGRKKSVAGEASRRARNPKIQRGGVRWGFVRRILFLRSPACSKAIPVLVFGLWLFY